MPIDRRYILIFGYDEMLLFTRRQMLEHFGYAVITTSSRSMVETCLQIGEVKVLVLCQTLLEADLKAVVKLHSDTKSAAPILSMGRTSLKSAFQFNEIYDVRKAPAAFVAAVQQLASASN